MIYIHPAECARCGQSLVIGAGDEFFTTGDLYLQITRDGTMAAKALCKNIKVCDEYLAAHP